MKLEHFLFVLDKVRTDIFCPKCKAVFNEQDTKLASVSDNELEFQMQCKTCRSLVCIRAAVMVAFEQGEVLSQKQNQQKDLNPAALKKLSRVLQSWDGNAKDLLSS